MKKCSVVFVIAMMACSRETPVAEQTATTATPAPASQTAPPVPRPRTYEDAVAWFRTTPAFRFVVEEGGVRGEGEMHRENVGVESIDVLVNGERWSASTGRQGVSWKREGQDAPAPEWGNRLFQRVTVAFDPQKVEGQAQLVEPGHWRFTDANSGHVHDVWSNDAGQITRMTIGSGFSMTFSNQK